MVWAAISWYTILFVPLIFFIADYVERSSTQVHPMVQTLFSNYDAIFQDDSAQSDTAETVRSWFEKHEGELQQLSCPA
jgi:hypothetical protein